MVDNDTRPGAHEARKERRSYFRFDSTVSMGTLLQLIAFFMLTMSAYGVYQSDKTSGAMERTQIRRDVDNNRAAVNGSINEMRNDVKDIQRTLADVSQSLAVLKARSEVASHRSPDNTTRGNP